MKKQYRYYERSVFVYIIELFHDGELVTAYKKYTDELFDELDALEEQGYSHGYSKWQVEEAKERYEMMLKNVI